MASKVSSSSAVALSDEARDALKKFRSRKTSFVVFRINDDPYEIVVDAKGPRKLGDVKDFFKALDTSHMRYVLYNHEFTTSDGRKTDKMYFVFWAPSAADNNSKMRYSTEKGVLRGQCDGVVDVHATEVNEIKRAVGLLKAEDEEFEDDDDEFDFDD